MKVANRISRGHEGLQAAWSAGGNIDRSGRTFSGGSIRRCELRLGSGHLAGQAERYQGSRADPRRDAASLGAGWRVAWRRLGHAQVQAQDLQAFVHRQIRVGRNAEPRRCRCGNLRRPFVTGRPEHKCKRRQLAHARSIISQFRWASCSPERVVSLNLVISRYEVTRCRTWAGPVPRPGRAWPQLLTSP